MVCGILLRVTELDPVIYILLALAAGIFLYTEGKILSCMNSRKEADCAWLIVLGAHVEGDRVTDSLKRRLIQCRGKFHHTLLLLILQENFEQISCFLL